jgi:hypothetical protein
MDIFYFVIAFAFAGLIFNCIMFKLKVDSVVRRHNSLMRDISAARFSLERAKETITEQSNTIEHLTKLIATEAVEHWNGHEILADKTLACDYKNYTIVERNK